MSAYEAADEFWVVDTSQVIKPQPHRLHLLLIYKF
jgi:hypothetical protein